jgi:hypothetical protein
VLTLLEGTTGNLVTDAQIAALVLEADARMPKAASSVSNCGSSRPLVIPAP